MSLLLLALVAWSILWKGGKGLEATWLLGGFAVVVTFFHWSSSLRSRDPADVPRHVWMLLAGYLLCSVISFLLSTARNYGLDELIRDAALILIFSWAVRRPEGESDAFWNSLAATVAAAALLACAIGLFVYVLQPVSRFVGTFFDWRFHTDYWPNAWAEFLLIAWPCAVLWSMKKGSAVLLPALGLLFGSLLLSFSRGAILSLGVQLLLGAVLLLPGFLRANKGGAFVGMLGTLLGIAALAVVMFFSANALRSQFFDVESVARKATFTAAEGASSVSERREFWDASFALSLQRPLFGWGPYSFRFVHPRLQRGVFATSDHPHNVFLKLMMERGWIAAALFLIALLSIVLQAANRLWVRGVSLEHPMKIAALIGASGVLVHNLIDYNLQFVGIALPFWLMLAAMTSREKTSSSYKKSIRFIELLAAVSLGIVLIIEGRALLLSSFGRHAEAAGNSAGALTWYAMAREEIFSRDMHLSRAGLFFQSGDFASAAGALGDYEKTNAEDARLWILRGNLAERTGNTDAARAAYDRALELGMFNYLQPLEGLLRIAAAAPEPLTPLQLSRADHIMVQFADAIAKNAHFIALSDSVESFGRISTLLQKLVPERASQYAEMAKEVAAHARKERSAFDARQPGLLW